MSPIAETTRTDGAPSAKAAGSGVVVKDLVKRFDEKVAVNHVSFSVHDGEFLVLVGPSGCGKTTTLRLLVGLEPLTSGEIRLGNRLVNDIRPRDRNVAMVFQDYAIFPHLTVFENIAYGLRSRSAPRRVINERVPAAARTFRIDDFLKRKPRQLSGGQRQRVALARAMVRDASLYLYDEPLSNLDAQLRYQAREDILTLHHEKGTPSVYVTHDQSEAMALGDRIAVMRDGQIQQIGTGTDLYERPQSRFVAFFIGTPSINLFDVELHPEGNDVMAVGSAFALPLPPEMRDKVRNHVGKQVILGVRPEDLHIPRMAPFETTEDNQITGVVTTIEPASTGSTVYLETSHINPQDFIATLKVRMPSTYLDKEVPLAIDVRKLQLFDAQTERSLLHGEQIHALH